MTLFVGGVHAVGKTSALTLACKILGVRHATASQLIREYRGNVNWSDTRQVHSIDENQRALIAAIKHLEQDGKKLVVDGHFVLRKAPKIHEEIEIAVFQELGPRALILLEAPSQIILERLQGRNDQTWELSEVEEFAQAEAKHAVAVASALSIPLTRLMLPSSSEIENVLMTYFPSRRLQPFK
ncbi:AAA family ATPase [Herbaspirillum seropedicae]|uniref:ATP-binding protein n=1 Tax=Herbaspirillum seropedicae TaxID=964 RepID=UPI00111CDBFC|nr:ATP-binding protein [Herbaspirillum seropedicae]QDD62697.1 AAA family ATPase [Herbaspirillum seropedicae]